MPVDGTDRIVRLSISGLVQGVGYRAFVEEEAMRRALGGWVRNRRDRSVEAVITGPPDAIGEMVLACRRGPPGSQVEAVEVAEADAAALAQRRPEQAFSVLPTI
jgi:acylphosphatase